MKILACDKIDQQSFRSILLQMYQKIHTIHLLSHLEKALQKTEEKMQEAQAD